MFISRLASGIAPSVPVMADLPVETTLTYLRHVAIVRTPSRRGVETRVKCTGDKAREKAWQRLRAYLRGCNSVHAALPTGVLVVQEQEAARLWRVRIHLPPGCDQCMLPAPLDPKVSLVAVPPETLAIKRCWGRPTGRAQQTAEADLRRVLTNSDWVADGSVRLRLHAPFFFLPFLHRSEIALPVRRRTCFAG